jgi:hypothetical protein
MILEQYLEQQLHIGLPIWHLYATENSNVHTNIGHVEGSEAYDTL